MSVVINVENVSKLYRLGQIGSGSIGTDFQRWLTMNILGKEDPNFKLGQANDRTTMGDSDIVYSLRDISFEVKQGETIGIIGRNGAGKSTLLKILSRITSPTTGSVRVRGRVASLLEVGTGFHPELTGRENIFLNGSILGMRKHEISTKLDEIIDFSGVERYIDTPVKRYSSGMYVRLAFAVAAHLESEILIVDEVLAVGDAEFQKKCLGKLGDLGSGEGRTVLFVSHNLGSLNILCNKGILLSNGELKFTGEIGDAIGEYTKANQKDLTIENEFQNSKELPVFIKKVELLVNGEKATSNKLDFLDLISFKLTIDVNRVVKNRGIVIHCNDNLERICQSFDISYMPELFEGRQPGLYEVVAEFPVSFLREGKYSFDFEVGHFGVEHEQMELEAIGIQIEVMSRNPRFEAATQNRPNKIFLETNWKYKQLARY